MALRLPVGWSVVRDDDLVWLAAGPVAGRGVRPRLAASEAPPVADLRGAVLAHLTALGASDPSLVVLDEGPARTTSGAPAYRALCSRTVGAVPCTAEHWVVAGPTGSVVAAGLAPTALWPALAERLRRALRSARVPA